MNPDVMRQDPAFSAMTLDILHKVLARADNPGRVVNYLTEEIRELTGARCVIFLQCLGKMHRVLGVNPTRYLAWAESHEGKRLHEITHNLPAVGILYPEEPSDASEILQRQGFGLSMAIPLNVGAMRVGAMLVLGLPDQQHLDSETKLLATLSTIVALVLRNSFLFENQEKTISERTKELVLAAFTLDNMQDSVFWVRPDASFSKVNASACRMLGYSNEEMLTFSVKDVSPAFPMDTWQEHWQQVKQAGSLHFEAVQRTRDGRDIPVDIIANYFELDGQEFHCALVRDISHRKRTEIALQQSEERFELAMRASSDGIFDWNLKTREIYFSPGWKNMLGYRDDELENDFSVWERLTNREQQVESWEILNEHLQGKRDRYEMEFQMLHKNGHWVDVLSRASAIFDKDGVPVRLIGTHVDITERKRAEAERKHLQAQLQQAQKMEAIGQLAGGIAHDFNNILGAILGYAEMVQEDSPEGSGVRDDIDQVVIASHRAKELVKQILAFSRQTVADRITLQPAVIIKEAVKMLRSSLPTTIDIRQDIDPDAGFILADPTQIHQILANLTTNAFHAMEETGGTITISLKSKKLTPEDLTREPDVQPGLFLEMSVGDTGPGIAPEIREKIFDPYFTTKEVGKGTGMGLAIIHGIAKNYGGFISCQSQPGEGAVFHVYLPVIADPALTEIETVSPGLTQPGNERILLIDDEEILVEMGKNMLERLGYRVTARTSSIEALNTFQAQPDRFDLVITDQTMPGMTGLDLARRMLRIRPKMPIILCTGFSNLISEEKAKLYGIKGFAMKPLAKNDLSNLIRKVLEQKQ